MILSMGATAPVAAPVVAGSTATAGTTAAAVSSGGLAGTTAFHTSYQFAVANAGYLRVLFGGMARITTSRMPAASTGAMSRMRLRETLSLFSHHAVRWGVARGPFICALLHGVRLGYAPVFQFGGIIPFNTLLSSELGHLLGQIGYVCPPVVK
jgi:hypothetical protein